MIMTTWKSFGSCIESFGNDCQWQMQENFFRAWLWSYLILSVWHTYIRAMAAKPAPLLTDLLHFKRSHSTGYFRISHLVGLPCDLMRASCRSSDNTKWLSPLMWNDKLINIKSLGPRAPFGATHVHVGPHRFQQRLMACWIPTVAPFTNMA